MIWFTCTKCGKAHGRTDNSAGTMIFCDCGHGNTVPWESTTAEPVTPALAVVASAAPKGPNLAPIQFDPVTISGPAPSSTPSSSGYPIKPSRTEDDERPSRRGRGEKRDPDFCFNHQRRPKADACAECGEPFCQDCLVRFQGVLLCGPCKNFRARRQELPPSTASAASASLVIALITGSLGLCLPLGSPGNPVMHLLSYLLLAPQVIAIGLGLWALHDAEKENKGGGQWVAVAGVTTASLVCVMTLLISLFAYRLV